MAGKLDGTAIVSGSITSTQLATSVNNSIAQGGGPKITQIQITDSSYNVLDDTAVSTSGGYIKITGTGFNAGAVVIIGTVNATSTAYVSSTTLNVQVPAAVAGTYVVYVVNTDGGTAIAVNGLTYSALPNWVTGSTLPSGTSNIPISIQLNATDATNYALAAGNTLPSGLTLSSGGLLSGTVTVGVETVYSFTVVATDAQLQDSPRAFTITITVGDPYFYLTSLLLPGNGTNNGTNSAFVDSSTNAYTVTRTGNATQGTFSPFSLTGWSAYFDGSGDYLEISQTTPFAFGTGDFTVECWINFFDYSNLYGKMIFESRPENTNGDYFVFGLGGTDGSYLKKLTFSAGATGIASPTALDVNKWYHVAATRSGTTLRLFVNGQVVASTTNSTNLNAARLSIGRNAFESQGHNTWFPGYISNARIVKGTALYTTNFTPSTSPLTAIANTSLLTCQSNRFIDNSTNNFTITKNGDVRIQTFSPFAPGTSYTSSAVGGSVYLDGTGDYLSTVTTPANFGSGDFTIETWVWFTTNSAGYQPLLHCTGAADYDGWGMITETSNILWFLCSTNGTSWTNTINTNIVPTTNCWTHLAVVRNGSTITYYVNGVSAGTTSIGASSIDAPSNAFYTGYYPYFPGGARSFNGYFSGTRLVKGSAVYTSNFTPPTAPPSPIANTSLLQNYTNGQIIDATSKNDLETVNDTKISTTQSKWGGSSIYLDGNNDYLYVPSSLATPYFNFGTGDFTIEFWTYLAANTTMWSGVILAIQSATGGGKEIRIGQNIGNPNQGWGWLYPNNANSADVFGGYGTLPVNTWNHIAMVRNGSNMALYLNGTSVATASGISFNFAGGNFYVGNNMYNDGTPNGYLNDIRVTRYARYTGNFTAPTSAFPTL